MNDFECFVGACLPLHHLLASYAPVFGTPFSHYHMEGVVYLWVKFHSSVGTVLYSDAFRILASIQQF